MFRVIGARIPRTMIICSLAHDALSKKICSRGIRFDFPFGLTTKEMASLMWLVQSKHGLFFVPL